MKWAGHRVVRRRLMDIAVLQGAPLLGFAAALPALGPERFGPLAVLVFSNILLVAHVFLVNDWAGAETDRVDPNRGETLAEGRRFAMGLAAIASLAASLAVFVCFGSITTLLAGAIVVLSGLYSLPPFAWKGRPVLSSVAHLLGGQLHFLLGYSTVDMVDGRGIVLGVYFGLVFAAGHLCQEVRDAESDGLAGITTNAVVFGSRPTFAASLALFALAHGAVVALVVHGELPELLGWVSALAMAIQLVWSWRALREGLLYPAVVRFQTRYRLLFAAVGAVMAASWLGGTTPA